MATGLKILSKLQLAKETVSGTAVTTATSKLTGMYKIDQQEARVKIRPQELRGSMAKFFRTITAGKVENINIEGTTTFEDIPYFFGMGFKGGVTATSDGGTPPAYTYPYVPTLTTEDLPDTYTVQYGDNAQAWYSEFTFAKSIGLDIQVDQLTKLTASLVGRQRTAQAFTGALSDRTTEDVVANNWILYLDDAAGGTIGTTQFGGFVINAQWMLSNYMPNKVIDGTLYFSNVHQLPLATDVNVTLEVDTVGLGLLAKFTGDTRQLLRLQNSGTQIHGGTPTNKRIRLDGAFNLLDWGSIGGADKNGIQTVQLKFQGEYDATYGKIAAAEVVNAIAALP